MAEAEGPFAVTAGYDLIVSLSSLFKDQTATPRVNRISVPNSQVNRIVITDDRKIAVATNPYVIIYDILSPCNNRPAQYSGHMTNVTDLVFTENQFFSCSEDRTWQIWDRRQQQIRSQKKVSTTSALNSMCLTPSQQCLITANEKGQVELWDVAMAKQVACHKVCQLPVRSIALSSDGKRLVAGCHDGNVVVLSVDDNGFDELQRFRAHDEELLKVEMAPDNSCFVTTSADSSAKLWDYETCALKYTLREQDQKKWVWDAAFTADSKFVCTGGTDKMYRTWNCQTGEMVFSNDGGHSKGITALAIFA